MGYLSGQIAAGADVVQLFDTWAGVLPETAFERWVIDPTRRIRARLKESFPTVPVIGFPRGAGLLYPRYAAESGVDAVDEGLYTVEPVVPDLVSALNPHVTVPEPVAEGEDTDQGASTDGASEPEKETQA